MRSRSVAIYLVNYSGNIIQPSLHCYENDICSNIAFLKYCISQTFHKFRLTAFQSNYKQKTDFETCLYNMTKV